MSGKVLDEIVEKVSQFSVLEVSELVKKFEEKLGVSAAAVAAPVMMAGPAAEGAAAEEKSSFDVVLKATGGKKLELIKAIRAATGGSLQESKEKAEKVGAVIKEALGKDEAEELKKKLEDAGATVELK